MSRSRNRVLLASVAFVAACTSVGPDYAPPERELPPGWRQERTGGLTDGPASTTAWWTTFGDPLLSALVEHALQQNLDLRASLLRLQASRALRGVAEADAWPGADLRASFEDRQDSRNTPFGAFIPRTNIHAIGVDAAWEIDLWGRVRRSIEAAAADLGVSEAEVHAAAVSVTAEVVAAYIDLRSAQRRLQIAEANLTLQQQTTQLVQTRLAAGLVGERDVAQATTNVESTRSRLPALSAQASAAQNRLAVLLGKAPAELPAELATTGTLPVPPLSVAVGVPADLLRRRPDVHAAERRFAAEVARIGVAEAERYPRLSLSGTLGLAANAADEVFTKGSDVLAFGPSLRWNLFDGGRLKHRVQALTARAEAAQVAWEQTLLLALVVAENAMTRFVREQERLAALQRAAAEARRAVTLAQTQYRTGLSDFQTVIDSERTVAAIEDELVGSEAAVAAHMVAIYKALGGGLPVPTTDNAGSDPQPEQSR